jgi:hypothetical protein
MQGDRWRRRPTSQRVRQSSIAFNFDADMPPELTPGTVALGLFVLAAHRRFKLEHGNTWSASSC